MLTLRLLAKHLIVSVLTICALAAAQAAAPWEEIRRTLASTPHPTNVAEVKTIGHLPCPNHQGNTSICWSFATCSFVESEMLRLKREPARLSVLYSPYCRYLEKARRFVQTRGNSRFNPGDLFTGVLETCQEYGALPASVYGPSSEQTPLDHTRLDSELQRFMEGIRQRAKWDEPAVLAEVRRILDRHLGAPPRSFFYQRKVYTPKSFADEVVNLPWNDYVMFTSFESAPFNSFTELRVPDNWRNSTNFMNLPLADFYQALKTALQRGFSVAVSMDNSEPAYFITGRYCVIPPSDVAAEQVGQSARELRFRDGRTQDDHAIHFLGYTRWDSEDWFLARDSCRVVWRRGNAGNLFLHESYVKLKILAFIVHRDGVPAFSGRAGE